ncbi:MAG: hypothetical protein JWM27_3965, partial [Gemmatimonadetes bacterium]|nr:hypothetical protein [Gemmatimonadota bacterium]
MRRTLAVAAAVALAACSKYEAPPGGPAIKGSPRVLATRPDTLAKVPGYRGPAVFVFNVAISEQGLNDAVNVSPRTSAVQVVHHGDEVRVSLARGWQPNRVYQVSMDRSVKDRFGNGLAAPLALVFSTGPDITETRVEGTATDRITGKPMIAGRVEAVAGPDSLVYSARSDSSGVFVFRYLPAGTYRVRAYNDTNKDRALQSYEARDTATVAVTVAKAPAPLRLSLLAPDTSAPKAGGAKATDDVVSVSFDDYLDPAQRLTPAQVRIVGPDSAAVPVREVRVGTIDTAATTRGADSAAARPPADSARRTVRTDSAAARDTVHLPSQTLSIRVGVVLRPSTDYMVTVRGVRNLNGLVGGGETRLRTPAPIRPRVAPADSARGTRPAGTA